jgi:hypothetical protein
VSPAKRAPAANAGARAAKPPAPPATKPASKPPKPPKALERSGDGYRSPDGRFTVEGTPGAWYVADTERPSPLGTPVIVGPFRTLAEVKAAVESAREA